MSGYSEGSASLTKKTLKSWKPTSYSAKSDIDANLKTLRNRAADLAMNTAVGSAAINVFVTNIIGAGLRLFPRPKFNELGMTPEDARNWSRHVKQEFELWANDCDFLRRNTFAELQAVSFASSLVDGDSFCLMKRRVGTPYSLKLQLIEAGRVSNPITGDAKALSPVEMLIPENNHRIVNGVEVNETGQLVAIHVSNRIWDEPSVISDVTWERVKVFGDETGCRNVLHICRDTRPDQFRGVPLLSSVVETIKQMSRYADSELTSAIIKSYFSIFFTQPETNHDFNQILGTGEDDPNEPCVDASEYRLGSATIAALPRGVDVKAIDSSNAQSTFESFTNAFLTQIGAALGLPYEVLLKKFQSSYSASRAALLQAQDEFRVRKSAFVNDFCRPIYEQFLTEAVALGRVDAPGFFDDPLTKSYWLASDWFNERAGILDPYRETQAMITRLANGLTTYRREIAETSGLDFDDVIQTLAQERDLLKQLLPQESD